MEVETKKCGIYKITSPTGRVYVGQSVNIKSRISCYKNLFCKDQKKLYLSLKKHGWDAHKIEIILLCDREDLNYWEKYYIAEFDSTNAKHGMNLTTGGDAPKIVRSHSGSKNPMYGKKHKPETIEKFKLAKRDIKPETHVKRIASIKGLVYKSRGVKRPPFSEEWKRNMSKSKKGKKLTPEQKERQRQAVKDWWQKRKQSL